MNPFFELLFDEGEATCFADNPKGTRILPISFFDSRKHAFFSINPIDGSKDRDPTANYHHALKPRRADGNVTAYRNLLVEMDASPLADQLHFVESMRMPFSSCVYSGGKSYHFILSLEEALADRASYDALVRRLYQVLGDRIDSACKNPSRLSRAPGFLRDETMKFQSLRELRERVKNRDLEEWLNEQGSFVSEQRVKPWPREEEPYGESKDLFANTKTFLSKGAAEGSWNQTLFRAACDCFGKTWTLEKFMEEASKISGHLDKSDIATIRSAWLRVNRRIS